MSDSYIVVDEFTIKDSKVLALNRKREFKDFNTSNITIDGKSYPYGLTHNEFWITVKTDVALIGKEVVFTA